jgi:tRNA 2-thiouridine synthesizing protein A
VTAVTQPTSGGPSPQPILAIDGGDRSCVQLLLELRRHTDQASPGTLIHLTATDPAAPLDLPAWCHLTGHTYLGRLDGPGPQPIYALQVTAAPRTTRAYAPWHPTDQTTPQPAIGEANADRE